MATMEAPPRVQNRLHDAPYKNEAFVDFSKEENVRKMRNALDKVRGQLGREYDLIIGGKRIKTAEKIRSINPAKPSEVVGIHQKAGKEHVEPAVNAALKAFATWSRTPVEERAALLFRAAELLQRGEDDAAHPAVGQLGAELVAGSGLKRLFREQVAGLEGVVELVV